jgi:hypothetical protein
MSRYFGEQEGEIFPIIFMVVQFIEGHDTHKYERVILSKLCQTFLLTANAGMIRNFAGSNWVRMTRTATKIESLSGQNLTHISLLVIICLY